jgi:hypothetical protein
VILPPQNLIFFDQEILPGFEYASLSSLNPFKSEGRQAENIFYCWFTEKGVDFSLFLSYMGDMI